MPLYLYHGIHPMGVDAMMPNDDARVGFELVKEWAIEFDKLWEVVGAGIPVRSPFEGERKSGAKKGRKPRAFDRD